MVYISPEEAAKKWQVNKRRVQAYCSEGKIPGAFRMGRQWMVPIEAEKPMDGRQKQARSSADFANYHFPIFAFSSAYSSQDALCEEEKEILKAQIATLQGNYLEALSICRPLTENASTLSIRLGAVFTSAYNCILLGLYTDLCSYLSTMEEYAAQKTVYSEDIKLLATICRFQFSFDTHLIHTIDFTKLTSEALTVFQLFQMQSSIFESNKETATAVTFFASLAQTFKLSGITPAVIFLYSVLSLHYGYLGDTETKSKYIAEACHLAFENKYYTQLSKYSNLDMPEFSRHLSTYGSAFLRKIERMRKENTANVMGIFQLARGFNFFADNTVADCELMLLLFRDNSISQIAHLKRKPKKEIIKNIDMLIQKNQLSSLDELRAFSKKVFTPQKARDF